MGKRKNKNGNKVQSRKDYINLVTALANLLVALILLYEKLRR
jgi:hypothetical protein